MRRYILFLLIFIACAFSAQQGFAQSTVPFITSTSYATPSAFTVGQTQQCIYSFQSYVNAGTITISTFEITVNSGTPATCFANATLYRSSSATSYTGGTKVGNVNLSNSGYVTITNLAETLTTTPSYYYLVADVIATGSYQLQQNNGTYFCIDNNGTNWKATYYSSINQNNIVGGGNYEGCNITGSSPRYLVSLYATTSGTADPASGLASTGTPLTSGLTNQPVFGFKMTTASTTTFTALNINSSLSSLSSYFGGFTLYSNSTNTFTGATQVTGVTATISGSFVKFSGSLSTSSTGPYYFLVANVSFTGSPTLPASVQFNLQTQQATNAALAVNSTTYNDFTAFGDTYSLNAAALTVVGAQNGLSSTTITTAQTNIALFGFGVSSASNIVVSGFNINSVTTGTGNAANYFGNGKLYKNTSNTYTGATLLAGSSVLGTSVTFSGNYATITGLSETITSTPTYYFLVADDIGGTCNGIGNPNPTTTFNFTNNQSLGAVVESSPTATSYNNFTVTGNAYTVPLPTINFASSTAGFTTPSNLIVGQTGVVIYAVTLTPTALQSIYLTTPNLVFTSTNSSAGNYFTNIKLKASTTGYANATLVSLSNTPSFNSGTLTATFSSSPTFYTSTPTTYYLIADITGGTVPATVPITATSVSTTSGAKVDGLQSTYSSASYSGTPATTTYTISNGYDWVGGTSTYNTLSNFHIVGSNTQASSLPTSSTSILIGVNQTYSQTGLTIPAGTTLSGLTVSNAYGSGSPTINVASGTASTVTSGIIVLNGASVTINGSSGGGLTFPSNSASSLSASSTLAITGGATVSNAGNFTTGASSTITLAGNSTLTNSGTFSLASTASIGSITSSTLANTGTFTLLSDANSSATIGKVTGTGASITGTYNVQRFITGGSGLRGYRLMSSPVYNGTGRNSLNVYSINYLAQSSYITGTTVSTNGIDKAGNPTLYLFRENLTPNQTSFTAGNFRGIGNMGTTTTNTSYTIDVDGSGYDIPVGNGYLFFFRGDRAAASLAAETVTSYVPVSSTATAIGTLNYGSITYTNWYTDAANLLFTNTTGNSSIQGYNLLGNPYASPIRWTTLYNANTTNLSNTMYCYNPATGHYGSFQASGTGTQNVSDYIGSGQGFFAVATNTGASVTFTEAMKVTNQPTTLLMGIPAGTQSALQYIHIKMVKDSVNFDDAVVAFKDNSDTKYSRTEDAIYINGNAPPEVLSTLSSDSVNLSINNMPLPGANGQTVKLYVSAPNSGTFTFKRADLVGIPSIYQIWLKDNLTKDSVDFRANDTYAFSIDNSNAATYGSNRFQLVFRQAPDLALHLLNFTGSQIAGVIQSQLNWKVENESNYTTFYIQRSTDGGQTFNSIGSLQSDSAGTYTFIDKMPVLGTDSYRLQLSDINNNITYSQVITLQYSNLSNNTIAGTMSVYPNPAQSELNISINAAGSSNAYSVKIMNSTGEMVKQISSASPSSKYDVSSFLPGTYYVVMTDNSTQSIVAKSKFVKL